MASAANYSARRAVVDGFDVLRLSDAGRRTEITIVPGFGNNAYEFKVDGHNIMWSHRTLRQLAGEPDFVANFFMAPWANRLDGDAFHANGRRYPLNPQLKNFRRDGLGLPIHGLLAFSPDWKVVTLESDHDSARATSRLEFWRHPNLMAQFPFAHTIEMTYRLRCGVLEVETFLQNHADEPMPVALGYHPCFTLRGATRASCKLHLGARTELLVSDRLVATGARQPLARTDETLLRGAQDMYLLTDLVPGPGGGAEFWVESPLERITLVQGPKYEVAVFYAPLDINLFCFEPMVATINALNPLPDGSQPPVPTIGPGASWQESFWIHHALF